MAARDEVAGAVVPCMIVSADSVRREEDCADVFAPAVVDSSLVEIALADEAGVFALTALATSLPDE